MNRQVNPCNYERNYEGYSCERFEELNILSVDTEEEKKSIVWIV
jgi:hypothetical protein